MVRIEHATGPLRDVAERYFYAEKARLFVCRKSGYTTSHYGFAAQYARYMPLTRSGKHRESPLAWAMKFSGIERRPWTKKQVADNMRPIQKAFVIGMVAHLEAQRAAKEFVGA